MGLTTTIVRKNWTVLPPPPLHPCLHDVLAVQPAVMHACIICLSNPAVAAPSLQVVMNVFNAAQPALLYIVPCVLGAVLLHAWAKGELMEVCLCGTEPPPAACSCACVALCCGHFCATTGCRCRSGAIPRRHQTRQTRK